MLELFGMLELSGIVLDFFVCR